MRRAARRFDGLQRSATVALHDLVVRRRAAGEVVLDLASGEPNFATPGVITEAATTAIAEGHTHYTTSRGIPELRAAIAEKLKADNGIDVDPDTGVLVTPSAKHALSVALTTVLDPGDEVLVPTPSWVSYGAMATLAGATAVPVPLSTKDDFALTAARLAAEVTDDTKAVLVNTPNNPTGRMLTEAEVAGLAAVAEDHDLIIIADEVYERIAYGTRHHSVAAIPGCAERTLTVNGFSKAYAMTGWRLGYLAGPADLIAEAVKVQEHTVSCAAAFTQWAGLRALTDGEPAVEAMVAEYARRRDLVVSTLDSLPGVRCPAPDGAFYAFPDISGAGHGDSAEFAEWLLRTAGVAVLPGTAFGPGGEGHVRISFGAAPEVLDDALARLAEVLR